MRQECVSAMAVRAVGVCLVNSVAVAAPGIHDLYLHEVQQEVNSNIKKHPQIPYFK